MARDKNTRILKCHVFRCDTPAKAIATSLHEICSRVSCSGRRRFQTQEANFGILADGCDEASQVVGQMFSLPLNIKAHGKENVVLMDFNFFYYVFKSTKLFSTQAHLKTHKAKKLICSHGAEEMLQCFILFNIHHTVKAHSQTQLPASFLCCV